MPVTPQPSTVVIKSPAEIELAGRVQAAHNLATLAIISMIEANVISAEKLQAFADAYDTAPFAHPIEHHGRMLAAATLRLIADRHKAPNP